MFSCSCLVGNGPLLVPKFHAWARAWLRPWDLSWVSRLVVLMAALAVAVLFVMQRTQLFGDEYSYTQGAGAVGGLLAGRGGSAASAFAALIGTGWFMPGQSLWSAPLYVVNPHPPMLALRAWSGSLGFGLFFLLVVQTRRLLGPLPALLLLVFPGLAALWHVATFAILPDVPGNLIAMLALLASWQIACDTIGARRTPWRLLLGAQAAFVLAIAMRGPIVLLSVAVDAALLLLCLLCGKAGEAWRIGLSGLLLPLLIAPWSIAASEHFEAPILTTTNVPLVIADSFGDARRTCFGPCPRGPDIWPAWRFAQDRAARTGENALTIERRMMTTSLRGLTFRAYLVKARGHFATFLFGPGGSLKQYMRVSYRVPKQWKGPILYGFTAETLLVYTPFILALVIANLAVFRRSDGDRLLSLAIKLSTACILAQPFVHKSGARYWVELAPLAAWSAALLLRSFSRAPSTLDSVIGRRLDRLQLAYGILFAIVVGMVLLA